ncbi:MAG: hypothetical protein COB83_07205 [Gammaproteobacteria bacterium]|nr:MAG: hypothetical protein COB83_07205 [Gammaproteobacteria bacterium]
MSKVLEMSPQGVATGVLGCQIPNTTAGDFTVARASTAAITTKDGLIEFVGNDIARVEFLQGETCPVLLTEPQSTNLVTFSEDFTDVIWNKPNLLASKDVVTAPDTKLTGNKIFANSINTTHYTSNSFTVVNGEDYALSVFVKKAEFSWVAVQLQGTGWLGSTMQVFFNTDDGTFGTVSGGVEFGSQALEDGWYRVFIKNQVVSTTANIRIYPCPSDNTLSYLGNSNDGVYIWGAQFEKDNNTSYIATSGAIATRLKDQVTGAGDAALFNDAEGVLYVESKALSNSGTDRIVSLSDGTTSNRVYVFYDTNNELNFFIVSGGVFQVSQVAAGVDILNMNRMAISWSASSTLIYVDGTEILSDPSITTPTGLSTLNLSHPNGTSNEFNAETNNIRVYDVAFTAQQMEDLTTP